MSLDTSKCLHPGFCSETNDSPCRYLHGHLAPIAPQHHYHYDHPSACMAIKKKKKKGEKRLRGDRGHLKLSLEVLSCV